MNSRKLLNLGLLAMVIGLGIIVMLDSSNDIDAPEPNKISKLNSTDINQILITINSNKRIELKKTNKLWRIIEPINIAANEVQVFVLLGLLNTISYGQHKVAEADLAKYGLDPPSVTINFNQNSFAIGDEDPVQHHRYILFNNTVHLIRDQYSSIAKSAPSGLINLAIMPENTKIKSLHLPDMKLDLIDGSWIITPPPDKTISQDTIRKLVDEWQFAQALEASLLDSVEPPELKTLPVHIEFSGDTPVMDLQTFSTDDERLLINPALGIQYHLTSHASARMFQLTEAQTTP